MQSADLDTINALSLLGAVASASAIRVLPSSRTLESICALGFFALALVLFVSLTLTIGQAKGHGTTTVPALVSGLSMGWDLLARNLDGLGSTGDFCYRFSGKG